MDSLYDLLSGALRRTTWNARLRPLPLSLSGIALGELSNLELRQLRASLQADGLAPYALARRRRPVVFVDLVSSGTTFAKLFELLRAWITRSARSGM